VPFLIYSILCLSLRVVGARLPEKLGLANVLTIALISLSSGLLILALIAHPSGVYLGTVVLAGGMALIYPSLMAFAVNSVTETERARVLASFTMFFEVGTVVGGLLLGSVARIGGERGAFAGGAVLAASGLWVLHQRLLPVARERRVSVAAPPSFEGSLAVGE
jgi:MFS family permease